MNHMGIVDQFFVFLMTICSFSLYGWTNASLELKINGKLVQISLRDGSSGNIVTVARKTFRRTIVKRSGNL